MNFSRLFILSVPVFTIVMLGWGFWPLTAQAESPPAQEKPDSSESWNPSDTDKRQSEADLSRYLGALNENRFEEAYTMLTPGLQRLGPFDEWKKYQIFQNGQFGGEPQYSNIQAVWKKDPPGSSGVYVIYNFQSRYKNVDKAMELVVLQQQEGESFKVVRHERNILDSKPADKNLEKAIEDLKNSDSIWIKTEKLENKASGTAKEAEQKQAKKMRDTQSESNISFLAVDIDGDGVELTSLWSANAVYWDIDMDGFAEATAWVALEDGLLALDRNEDGIINNNDELFGSAELDGFATLAAYDSNKDGKIDASDPIWEKLLIWQDKWLDGVSKPNELFAVKGSHIISIDLANTPVREIKADNKVTLRGQYSFQYAELEGVETKTRAIENVQASYTNTNTLYDQDTPLDVRAMYLPTLRGYGNLPELHVAMSIDNEGQDSLLERVRALDAPFNELFAPDRDLEREVHEILYRWANVHDLDPDSRGPHIDARRLGYLEMMMGKPFIQKGANNAINPLFWGAIDLKEAYLIAYNNVFARLIVQSAGRELFTGNPTYVVGEDKFAYIKGLDHRGIQKLKDMVGQTSDLRKRRALWKDAIRSIEYTIGIENLTKDDGTALNDAIEKSLKGEGILSIYQDVKFYKEERSYWPYIITDRLYKYFGIRLSSNLPIFGVVFLGFFGLFFSAYQKRKRREASGRKSRK